MEIKVNEKCLIVFVLQFYFLLGSDSLLQLANQLITFCVIK